MSENKEKYFCHFGDLKVKDAEARELLSRLQKEVKNKDSIKETNVGGNIKFWVGTEEQFEQEDDLDEETTICYVYTPIEEQIEQRITEVTEEKLTEFDERLTNHNHEYNIFVLYSKDLVNGSTISARSVNDFYGYMAVVEITENVYGGTKLTLPLTFHRNIADGEAGWYGYGTMHCKYDNVNDHYITCQVTVDISGKLETTAKGNYVITFENPYLALFNADLGDDVTDIDISTLVIKQIP